MKTAAAILIPVSIWATIVGTAIYGIVLSFSASVVVGFITLVVSPMGFVIGACKLFGDIDLAQRLATALGLG